MEQRNEVALGQIRYKETVHAFVAEAPDDANITADWHASPPAGDDHSTTFTATT
jgi:hypothetical protein